MNIKQIGAISLASLALIACNDDDKDNRSAAKLDGTFNAVVQTSTYGVGSEVQIIGVNDTDESEPFSVSTPILNQDATDFIVSGNDVQFYQIGRFGFDTLQQFNVDTPSIANYTYSLKLNAEDTSGNTQAMAFASDTKAYMPRLGENKVWIVNPQAETEVDFYIDALDLSAYDDADGSPDSVDVAISNGRVFVLMQRLESYVPTTAYVAVFNETTGEEIMTANGTETMKGIQLSVRNPRGFLEVSSNTIAVVGSGDPYGGPRGRSPLYDGGVEEINTQSLTSSIVLDDGDEDNHPYGFFRTAVYSTPNVIYFAGEVTYDSEGNYVGSTSLYKIDLSQTDAEAEELTDFAGTDITFLKISPNGKLWVGIASYVDGQTRIEVLDNEDTIEETISLAKSPRNIAFIDAIEE